MSLVDLRAVLNHAYRDGLTLRRCIRSNHHGGVSGCIFHRIAVIAIDRGSDRAGDSRLINRCVEVVCMAGTGADHGLLTVHDAHKLIGIHAAHICLVRYIDISRSSRVCGSLNHIVSHHNTGRDTSGLNFPDHSLVLIHSLQSINDARNAARVRNQQSAGVDRYPVGGNHRDHKLIAVNDLITDIARRVVYIAARDRDQQLALKAVRCQFHIIAEGDRRDNRLVQFLVRIIMLRIRNRKIGDRDRFLIYIEVCRDRTAVIADTCNRRRRLASRTGIIGHGIIRSLGQCGASHRHNRRNRAVNQDRIDVFHGTNQRKVDRIIGSPCLSHRESPVVVAGIRCKINQNGCRRYVHRSARQFIAGVFPDQIAIRVINRDVIITGLRVGILGKCQINTVSRAINAVEIILVLAVCIIVVALHNSGNPFRVKRGILIHRAVVCRKVKLVAVGAVLVRVPANERVTVAGRVLRLRDRICRSGYCFSIRRISFLRICVTIDHQRIRPVAGLHCRVAGRCHIMRENRLGLHFGSAVCIEGHLTLFLHNLNAVEETVLILIVHQRVIHCVLRCRHLNPIQIRSGNHSFNIAAIDTRFYRALIFHRSLCQILAQLDRRARLVITAYQFIVILRKIIIIDTAQEITCRPKQFVIRKSIAVLICRIQQISIRLRNLHTRNIKQVSQRNSLSAECPETGHTALRRTVREF